MYLVIELISFLGLRYFEFKKAVGYRPIFHRLSEEKRQEIELIASSKSPYFIHDPLLGWTVKPNSSSKNTTVNSQGLRGDREYSSHPPMDKIRIAAFGESFTQGAGVPNEDTWEEKLVKFNPKLEVLNFGIGGYGLDQAFLRYQKEGTQLHPKIIVIAYMTENINRNVSVFRPFYHYSTGIPFTKPRFIIERDKLVLIENPSLSPSDYRLLLHPSKETLARITKYDYFFKTYYTGFHNLFPSLRLLEILYGNYIEHSDYSRGIIYGGNYNAKSEAFLVTLKIFEDFYQSVLQNNSEPLIIIYPDSHDIERYRKHHTKKYAVLLDQLNAKNYRVVDLMGAFETFGKGYPIRTIFGEDGHYSAIGNEIVAKYLNDYLIKNHLV